MDHPLIKRFEAGAELLEIQRDGASVEDAVIRLAAWMDLAADHLTEDDEVVLVGIGAMLYREGLRRRLDPGSQ